MIFLKGLALGLALNVCGLAFGDPDYIGRERADFIAGVLCGCAGDYILGYLIVILVMFRG
jgi:hypothetical protein